MNPKFRNIYFIGIGGIGMSAIAKYLHLAGYKVAGYDLVKNQNCEALEKIGIDIHYEENISAINPIFLNVQDSLIVYTPAIPKDHKEYLYFTENNFRILKRSEILGLLSKSTKSIAIAGTHGKTSVSTLTAWILHNSMVKCTAFLGGISKNISSNLLVNTESDFMVLEADEFDRSFLRLNPYISLVTIIEADHLDIYGNTAELEKSFIEFINKTNTNGSAILNSVISDIIVEKLNKDIKIYRYSSFDSSADFYIKNLHRSGEDFCFDIIMPNSEISGIKTKTGGNHNLENIVAASAAAHLSGVRNNEIKNAIESYTGVQRRFDIKVHKDDRIFIDDYAHHPSEIRETIKAVREMYPQKKITGVFQPHLFSRTKDFAEEFGQSLSELDNLYLLPIYPAREKPLPGISSKIIFDNCNCKNKYMIQKEELYEIIRKQKPELLLTMGAGDIDRLIKKLTEIMENNEG